MKKAFQNARQYARQDLGMKPLQATPLPIPRTRIGENVGCPGPPKVCNLMGCFSGVALLCCTVLGSRYVFQAS